ncbi:hypothetical protein CLV49_0878 [Labedella gwakjiensis]|uniref:Uncharacterized protein n=1 Tax=Labedella gwakjiensis TaxID=390269 RepID=A0A2P8GTI0_9MICO|nr:hypothetical protein [Labedella gwakjiensis]PSL37271.1 hypothetical protein CLV49_0878 [Labedella gwakjiensis]RUQ84598.1 hypothetical protein ELQ93_13410 [Labedella gwakjiensis]
MSTTTRPAKNRPAQNRPAQNRPAQKSPVAKSPVAKSPATKSLAKKSQANNRPATGIATNRPVKSRQADSAGIGTVARDQAAADRRLAALADELARRDSAANAERESRRPLIWLLAMTLGAVALAQLAVYVMVAPPV